MLMVIFMQAVVFAVFFGYKLYTRARLGEIYGLLIASEAVCILYSLMYMLFDKNVVLILNCITAIVGVYIAYIDIKKRVISMKLCLVIMIASFVFAFIRTDVAFYNPVVTAVVGFFLAKLMCMLSKQQIGDGDVKLIAVYSGAYAFAQIISVLIYSFFSCLVAGLALVLLKKKNMKFEIPFAPFMVLGALIFDIFKYMAV